MNTEFKLNNAINSDSLIQVQLDKFSQLNSLKESGKNFSTEEKQDIAEAARGFESLFVNMMLKEMKSAMLGEDEDGDGGFGSDVLEGYADMMLSEQISKTGTGIGIADMLYSQLTGGDTLKPITTEVINQQQLPIINSEVVNKETAVGDPAPLSGSFLDRLNARLDNYDKIIAYAAKAFNVPENLIKAIISAESAGRSDARSTAGAKGLMQLMDGTADSLGVNNSFDPYQNIMGGTQYLRMMLDRFDGNLNLALAAYNAGPGNVEKYNDIPPFKETQAYVVRVKKYLAQFGSEGSEEI